MRLTRFAVHHPILTIMVMLIVILLGAIALTRLPIDLMPDITYPTLSIMTTYENASPEEIEELVTRPVEEAMSSVPGAEEVSSVSVEGRSTIRVSFAWGTDLDAAANDIRDRLDRVIRRLPEEAERPTLRKFDLASFPVLILGASSNLDPIQERKIIDEQVKYRIERVPGVAALDVWGGLDREIHVSLDPDKLKALDVPLDQIVARVRAENADVPAGGVHRGRYDVMVRTLGSFEGIDEIRDTVVAVREGVPVRLGEIAEVDDSWRKVTRIIRVNGRRGVRLAVNKQSGANTVEVAKGVLKEVGRINRDIPQLNLTPVRDTSEYIRRSISGVSMAALFGGGLAVVVLLFFLRDLRSTGTIAVAIPVSVVATFALIYFGGFTLNIMTLGGLALGIGMLLDNSIVVLENTCRLRETGLAPFEAATKGSGEVAAAISASTLTTLAVFLPLIFMRGMSGVMYTQLCYVVAFALICSFLVALTVVPMLAARARHTAASDEAADQTLRTRASRRLGGAFVRMEEAYVRTLRFALGHRKLVAGVAVALLAGSLALIPHVGAEFMPSADEGEVRVYADMEVGTRLDVTDARFREIERVVMEAVPEAEGTVVRIGGSHWRASGSHSARMTLSLKPETERTRSSDEIATDLRRRLSGVPGFTVRTRAGQGLFILRMGTGGDDKIQVEIRGYDLRAASELADRVKALVEGVPGVTDARLSRETGSPEEIVTVNRRRAADMGLTVSEIAATLQTALSGTTAGYYRERGSEYGILVKLRDAENLDLQDVLDLTVTNSAGEPVVLRNVVDTRPREGPMRIERKDQERVVTVSAEIEGRGMGSVVADIREALRAVPVPRDFQILFGGDYEEQQESFRELLISLALALALVYMVMAGLYESLRDPFVVMFSVPVAAIGVILMLYLTDTTFNVQSFIGCIMLGGIVVNNAILLVDHTNLLRRRDGMALGEAIEEAGRRRLRPILMTATTTVLALLPLAMGLGEGGEAQAPLARAVIGGLLSSTPITLILVPTVYSIVERRRRLRQ